MPYIASKEHNFVLGLGCQLGDLRQGTPFHLNHRDKGACLAGSDSYMVGCIERA